MANPQQEEQRRYLQQLGARVRDARIRLDLSRKMLAATSGVSERYLAQLEAGRGNISILLLRQVAQALSLALPDLLREEHEHSAKLVQLTRYLEKLPPRRLHQASNMLLSAFGDLDGPQRRHRIALVGLRGAGKSTLGLGLARALNVPFIELDSEIEREAGVPLSEIFSLYGQDAYRRLERRCLERVVELHARAVIATGGSLVTEAETYDVLRASCFTIWLRAHPEEHMQRVIDQGDMRPMTGRQESMSYLRTLLADREGLYRLADATLDTGGRTAEQSLAELISMHALSRAA